MTLRNPEPSVLHALEEFPEETPSQRRESETRRATPLPVATQHSLLEFLPAGPPVDADVATPMPRGQRTLLRGVRMQRVLARNFSRSKQFVAFVVGGLCELAVAGRRRLRRVFMSAATTLVPHCSPRWRSIGFGSLALVSVILAEMILRPESRLPLPATVTALSVPVAIPTMASIERPLLAAAPEPELSSQESPALSHRRTSSGNDAISVQRTLNRYRDAFSTLDVATVKAIWPSADEDALRKQFAGLYDQNVEFDSCRISVDIATAVALCRGSISYARNRQIERRHSELKNWQFTLLKEGNRWIVRTAVDSTTAAR